MTTSKQRKKNRQKHYCFALLGSISRKKLWELFLLKKKIVKTQRFCTVCPLTTLVSREQLAKIFQIV